MIKKVYIVHHSHTDVGYTDLQEQIIYNQVNNIRNVVSLVRNGYEQDGPEKGFKWNCETYYCVEQFLKSASPREQEDFFELVRKGNIGISATYLNFNDLADADMLDRRTAEMQTLFTGRGLPVRAAMNADINGISLGARDALIKNGIEFLFTNIHTHHGMYPLYQNQTPYFWESEGGGRLLVWNGEHYNLGNALGIVFNRNVNYMTESYFGKKENASALDALHDKLAESIREYEDSGYPYDFYITSVSGVFSDNAPANPAVIATVNAFNERFGGEVELRMVTLEELYGLIREQTAEAPVYRGAINDWWGNGVGSTPYAVKHYREALRLAHTCDRLEEKTGVRDDGLARTGEDKETIRDHVTRYYRLDFTLDEIRKDYTQDTSCAGSVPQALEAFFEAEDFEDAIRGAISIGGDSDTIATITGGVAAAFYGVPKAIRAEAMRCIDGEVRNIYDRFAKEY